MPKYKGRDLVRWFSFYLVLSVVGVALPACGSVTRGKTDPLAISLSLPAGEDPEFFWYGVKSRSLRVIPLKGDPQAFAWEPGSRRDLDLQEGDQLVFLGFDEAGRLRVTGQTTVGQEKKATIPLRRVL